MFTHGIRNVSVVFLLRDGCPDTNLWSATLLELLRTRLLDLHGAFTTVGVRKVQIRKL